MLTFGSKYIDSRWEVERIYCTQRLQVWGGGCKMGTNCTHWIFGSLGLHSKCTAVSLVMKKRNISDSSFTFGICHAFVSIAYCTLYCTHTSAQHINIFKDILWKRLLSSETWKALERENISWSVVLELLLNSISCNRFSSHFYLCLTILCRLSHTACNSFIWLTGNIFAIVQAWSSIDSRLVNMYSKESWIMYWNPTRSLWWCSSDCRAQWESLMWIQSLRYV